jgi:CRP-like cAMP-binding protein
MDKSEKKALLDFYRSRGRVHAKQVMIYHQGALSKGFFRVNSGMVMCYRLLENSQRQISEFYSEGDFFGLSAGTDYWDSAITLTTANVVLLSQSEVTKNPALQTELFLSTCKQLEANQSLITTLSKKTAKQKIITFINLMIERQGLSGKSFDVSLPMSRLDIADYLGMSIETVSRQLTQLKQESLIGLPSRDIITINDLRKLQALIGSS